MTNVSNNNAHNKLHLIFLTLSFTLWVYSVGTFRLGELHLEYTPFMMLTSLFWIGFMLVNVVFFWCGNNKIKYAALIMLSFYSIITLVIIEPYGRMHDSIVNIYNSELVVSGLFNVAYNGDYPGFYLWMGTLANIIDINPWLLSRIFPLFFLIIYIPFLLALFRIIASNTYEAKKITLSISLFLYFMVVFIPTIWIRMNPAPQTMAYLLSILLLILLLKKSRIDFKILFLIIYFVLLISHPLTPLFSIPGFIVMLYINNVNKLRSRWLKDVISSPIYIINTSIIITIVLYLSWILYVADGIFVHAIRLINEVSTAEKSITGVTQNTGAATLYDHINIIYLSILLLLLIVLYLKNIHSIEGQIVTIWILMMLPHIIMSFGSRFFSRLLLFLSIAAGIVFSSLTKLSISSSIKKLPVYLVIFLICLSSIGIYRSQYIDNALDRPTLSEIRSHVFAASKIEKNAAMSFNIPYDEFGQTLENKSRVMLDRHLIDIKSLSRSNAIIISQQMRHYSSVKEGKYDKSFLGMMEHSLNNNAYAIYENGHGKIFVYSSAPQI